MNQIEYNKELFYALGALLGDGCAYHWKRENQYIVNLSGDKNFTEKYANKVKNGLGMKAKAYINRRRNIWFVNIKNAELYNILKELKSSNEIVQKLIENNKSKENHLQFIEGFFDAEGCVKIIKEKVRRTPKICLDITNTNFKLIEIVKNILREQLNIEAKYSNQEAFLGKDGFRRSKVYHLRIYKKEYIKRFFDNISTTKLRSEKIDYVNNWLKNGK